MQFPLEPGVIRYEQLKPAEQAAIDQLRETVETTQLPASHEAFSRAAGRTAELVERELAARSVGLVGTDQDGVVTP